MLDFCRSKVKCRPIVTNEFFNTLSLRNDDGEGGHAEEAVVQDLLVADGIRRPGRRKLPGHAWNEEEIETNRVDCSGTQQPKTIREWKIVHKWSKYIDKLTAVAI